MKKWADGINEAREIARKINRKNGGEMCAYIYEGDILYGYWIMDECDEPGNECLAHIETWQYGEISYSAV